MLLVAALWIFTVIHDSTPMPVYEGKTGTELLERIVTTGFIGEEDPFSQMGSNAVPFLVHELSRKDSVPERISEWLYPKLPLTIRSHVHLPLGEAGRWDAAAIGLKDANSRTAIPALIKLLADGNSEQRSLAIDVLGSLLRPDDTNCIPALMSCLRSQDITVCVDTIVILQRMNAEKPAMPALTNFITSTNWQVRLYALDSLSHLDTANSNKWHAILTNDPDWIAEQRLLRANKSATNAALNGSAK